MPDPIREIGRTEAFIAAKVLRKAAAEHVQSAGTLAAEFPQAAENCRTMADWLTNVAGALEDLDRDAATIRPRSA